ncbi:MAG TPA: tripartite tricarboxylate transporter substrate binding protein [Xanthobacteraceae bacterium]|nr:tripartite tricarboxylate transporter substrate binding protein [Xanthobacteraceae bacterium]
MTFRSILVALVGLGVSSTVVHAQAWPQKPLRAVVPFAAGSSTDIVPRIVFEQLGLQLGQTIVVENRAGAGGTIGALSVAKAESDGYTLLASGSSHTIAPALYPKLGYDPARDFIAVVPFGISPNVLVVSPASAFKTAADLVAAAKARPGALTFSSVGVGTATHMSAERFNISTGIDALHIPFKGGAEAMTEVIAGRVDYFFGPPALVGPQIRDGKLRALAVNGRSRSPFLPNVPTTRELGFIDAEYPIWYGLFVPSKTPREIVDRLRDETAKALQAPRVRERLDALAVDPMPMTAGEFEAFVQNEIVLNAALVRKLGLKTD